MSLLFRLLISSSNSRLRPVSNHPCNGRLPRHILILTPTELDHIPWNAVGTHLVESWNIFRGRLPEAILWKAGTYPLESWNLSSDPAL